MPASERPSSESKTEMQVRHKAELQASGHVASSIKRWGTLAGAITAIIVLAGTLGTQVWPTMVSLGLGGRDEQARKTAESVARIDKSVGEMKLLLEATITAAGNQVHDSDIRAERVHGSIEALRNEVRLRHGVFDLGAVINNYGLGSGSSSGSGVRSGGATRAPAAAPRLPRMSRQQQVQAVAQHADKKLNEAKKPTASKSKFREQVKAELKRK